MSDPRDEKLQHGVDAGNDEYLRYDQVEKTQRYRFAEQDGAEAFDEETRVATCDMGPWFDGGADGRRQFADQLGASLSELGFAILEGHGIDPALHDRVARTLPEVFDRPQEEKLRFRAARHGSVSQGYFAKNATSDIHPDLVEGWVFCRRAFDLPGREPVDHGPAGAPLALDDFWPERRFEPIFRELVEANEALMMPVMRAMLMALGVDPGLYDRKLTRTNIGLRLNYYPPIAADEDASGAGRLLGHEDVALFTLLPAPRVEGLQVLNRANGKWIRVLAPPGSILLNTGDYMQRISNDRFPSTTHRVSKPRDPADRSRGRVSFPMNTYVWEDEILEVLPGLGEPHYPPVRAIEFHTRSTAKFYGDDYAVEGGEAGDDAARGGA